MRSNYLWYQFFRYVMVRPSLRMFHSKVTVSGIESVPKYKPVIFVPNHQNAFLDALHVVTNTSKFVHFLTRARPFKNPLLNWFFRSLNMLPVYRVRNGFSAIKKNEQIFDECARRLRRNDAVLVFAEASQAQQRRVRPFSKGFTRIAFGAEEKYDWNMDLQVVPVGINYADHKKARKPVHLEFGKPIPVKDFKDQYLRDEREAAHGLKEKTAERLKQLTMHTPNLKPYPVYELLLDDLESERELVINPSRINKRVEEVSKRIDPELVERAARLQKTAEENNIKLRDFVAPVTINWKDIVLSPVYLFSLINNILPFQAVRWVVEEYLEDHVFDGSVKYLIGLLGLPVYYLIICGLMALANVSPLFILAYLLASVTTAPYFVRAKDILKKSSAEKLKERDQQKAEEIREEVSYFTNLRKQIFGE